MEVQVNYLVLASRLWNRAGNTVGDGISIESQSRLVQSIRITRDRELRHMHAALRHSS